MERCPACRARLADADICARCGVDLSIARWAERQAHNYVCRAVHQFAAGHLDAAVRAAATATTLTSPPLAHALLAIIRRQRAAQAIRPTVADTDD